MTTDADALEASAALAELREVERLVGSRPLRAFADVAEGKLAAARGDHERARTLLEDGIDRFERSGAPFEAARARVELATSLLALGRAEDAGREASAAAARLHGLGASAEAARARAVVEALGPRGGRPTAGVTPRERDVLALLAEGLTNREIAERLVVSEHTVHRHVANILRKLGLPSRTAAAAHAVRSRLLDT